MNNLKISPFLFFGVLFFVLGFPFYMIFGAKFFGENSAGILTVIGIIAALSINIYLRFQTRKSSESNKSRSHPLGSKNTIGNYFLSSRYSFTRKLFILLLAIFSFAAAMTLIAFL